MLIPPQCKDYYLDYCGISRIVANVNLLLCLTTVPSMPVEVVIDIISEEM